MGRKKLRRKSKSAAGYIFFATVLSFFLLLLGLSVFLRITEIEVHGALTHPDEEIISVSGIAPGDNMMLINTQDAERSIRAAMPIISEANISRSLPDRIIIQIKESVAFAAIRHRTGVLIIDSAGRVLEQTNAASPGLIEIRGIETIDSAVGGPLRTVQADGMRLQYMTDVLAALEDAGIGDDVTYLEVENISNINFDFGFRYRVILGGPEGVRHKLSQMPDLINRNENRTGFDAAIRYVIDMSDPTGEWRVRVE